MNINLTLIGQTITFIVFVWFCMKFVWPPLVRILDERKKTIADGLAAGERGRHELELAEKRALEVIRKAKQDAAELIGQADKRAAEIAEQAKVQAKNEADRILATAKADIDQEVTRAKESLRVAVADLAVVAAGRILEKEVDPKAHAKLLDAVVKQL